MRAVFGLVLIVGMGLAGFAVYMVNQYIEGSRVANERLQNEIRSAVRTVDVLTPVRDLTYGDLLTLEDFQTMPYAEANLPEGVFRTEEELFPEGTDVNRVVILPMRTNEPITDNKVSEPGASRGLTALVEPGTRAFPIEGQVAAGFGILRPQDRIDIYWTGALEAGGEVTRLIRSGMEIIAVTGDGAAVGRPQSVVLQVTPQEVGLLTQAQNSGQLTLSLVGTGDTTETGPVVIDNLAVTGEELVVEEAPEVVEERECFITQRNGVEVVQVPIQCAD